MMIFGGYAGPHPHPPCLARSQTVTSSIWAGEHVPDHAVRTAAAGQIRVTVLGPCGALTADVEDLAERGVPHDAAWRWAGAYVVAHEPPGGDVVLYTDPAAARPVYVTRHADGWVWSSSARALAGLRNAGLDVDRISCAITAPGVLALTEGSTFYAGVYQLPTGARIRLPAHGGPLESATLWVPAPGRADPVTRLRTTLLDAVALRTRLGPRLSCDLSGGLDSTSPAVIAASMLPAGRPLEAVTVHPAGNRGGADLRYARIAAAAYPDRITHRLLPLTADELPYTGMAAVPVSDEPAPSTTAQARFLGQMRWMKTTFDADMHMTGDGGDSIMFVPPLQLAALIRRRRLRRVVGEAFGWARLRRATVRPILLDAVRGARTSRIAALHELAQALLAQALLAPSMSAADRADVAWFAGSSAPAWATEQARRAAAAAAHAAAYQADPLDMLDDATRCLVDQLSLSRGNTAAVDVDRRRKSPHPLMKITHRGDIRVPQRRDKAPEPVGIRPGAQAPGSPIPPAVSTWWKRHRSRLPASPGSR
ncbi:asparagine synthase (glutamine-hydrolyzing) [Streptosporangium album]|uniref:Asparagine synthase (Glutamine-hydrolyzing) n=1 Tax=Streptosporangium album TaxID=47479 RepID=A0A7W7W7I8_9ACTN|nr:albusnodin/ikarugamycin family macrolactam cyclase [Streptosporangium album]MBB4935970.1 asparagine synthase (glutamine-hydrolyzing) [Streptosporangium album]